MDRKAKYESKIKKHVMVVDDESINRQMLGYIVSQDYEVTYAENGKEALELIKAQKKMLSLILLDILMPVMDGFELLKELKSDEELKKIPVIVLTSEESAEVKSLELGAADFIKKPYDMPEVILARINRIIELAEGRDIIKATERDNLTGLYNREFFYEYAHHLDQYYGDWSMDAVVMNVEHFQLINELHGRQFGDQVLKSVADMIRMILSSDTDGYACRYEADVFYIYCRHLGDYEKLQGQLSKWINELSNEQGIRVRMGVYPQVDRSISIEQRFDRARLACNNGRNKYMQPVTYYDAKAHENSLFSQKLIGDIGDAIENKQLKVYYQPKYNIKGDKPVLTSCEALVRWDHPEYGLISPGQFIPLFEHNGLIQLVDHFVWEEAAKQVRKWKDEIGRAVPVSVNVSRLDLYDPDFETGMVTLLVSNNLDSSDYLLEITESAYAEDTTQVVEVVNRLRDQGFKIEMDDFGSGYSSLNMVSELPLDVLKLDMRFIKNIHTDKKAYRLIELIMEIADFLQVAVVAEGVEFEEQYKLLKEAGCDVIQGFYFSKPLPASEFEKLLIEE
ncbi:MAG: EAL domain-containing protein [Lachnospiraceae bacterium]|nr:EAL domain-containing protein [Lachnospiraceae bacterium]